MCLFLIYCSAILIYFSLFLILSKVVLFIFHKSRVERIFKKGTICNIYAAYSYALFLCEDLIANTLVKIKCIFIQS